MASFQIIIASGQRFDADLAKLQKYSKYYLRGFNGNFGERNESYLDIHATETTVTKFFAITAFLTARDDIDDGDYNDKYPLDWKGGESWEFLFKLWLFANYLLAPRVTAFIEEYLNEKARSDAVQHESEALTAEIVNKFWGGLQPRYHGGLRTAIIVALTVGPAFNSDVATRDQLLDELPADAQRAMLHQLHKASVSFRNKAEEVLAEYVEKAEDRGWGLCWSTWAFTQGAMERIRGVLGFGPPKK